MRKADLNQTGRLLTIYTKNYGKILVRAKGVGKKESKLKSLIEPFNLCEFMLAKSKTIDVLTGVYPIKELPCLHSNLVSLAYAFYFAELIDKLVVAPERDEKVWALLKRAMEVLDKNSSPQPSLNLREGAANSLPYFKVGVGGVKTGLSKIKSLFEEKLLEFLGHPSFSTQGKLTDREKQHYINSLAGEEIKSKKFLAYLDSSF